MAIHDFAWFQNWFEENESLVIAYIESNYDECSWLYQFNLLKESPILAKILIEDEDTPNEDKVERFINNLTWGDKVFKTDELGKLVTVTAGKRGGKTAFGFWACEEYRERKRLVACGFITKKINPKLPGWMSWKKDLEDVDIDSLNVIDEGALSHNARRSMDGKNKDDTEKLPILSHKHTTVFANSQHSKLLDCNFHRTADIVCLKHGAPIHRDMFESDLEFEVAQRMKPRNESEVFVLIRREKYTKRNFYMRFYHPIPRCWSEKLSKSYKDVDWKELKQEENEEKEARAEKKKAAADLL